MNELAIKGTTIFAVKHNGKMEMAGYGQVKLGNQVIIKNKASQERR